MQEGALRCTSCPADYPKRSKFVDVFLDQDAWEALSAQMKRDAAILKSYAANRRSSVGMKTFYDWWVSRLLALIPAGYERILGEIMAGGGEVVRRLPSSVQAAVALDLNVVFMENTAEDLKRRGEERVRVVCASADRLPVPSESLGAVVVQGALHHVRPILPQVLSEIHRVLQPDGVLIGSEPADDSIVIHLLRRAVYAISSNLGIDEDERGFGYRELQTELAAAGLTIDHYQPFGFVAYPLIGNTDILGIFRNSDSSTLFSTLISTDKLLERIPLIRRLGWASLYRARKVDFCCKRPQ